MAAATDNVNVAKKVMKQYAVYWAFAQLNQYGKPEWDAAIEISCRWEDSIIEIILSNSERVMTRAELIVDRDLKEKGVLWLGRLTDVPDLDDPKNNDGAWEILQILKTPDFKGKRFLREAYL